MAARAQEKVEGDARFNILLQENAQLKESRADEIARQVAEQMADKDAKIAVERAMHQQELTKVKAEVEKLKRIGDQRTSQRLGEMGELEIFNALKAARPQDRIIRVPKGQEGADLDQFFVENRKEFGSALLEIKNASRFAKPYITKLLDNQLKAGRDWGILVLGPTAFPPGVAPVAQPYEGVLLCPSGHVVPLMETLRRFTWKLHQMKATSEDGDARRARLFARFATDKGRALLQRVNDGYSKLRELDSKLQGDVNRHISQSAAIYEAHQRCLGDVFDAIDRLTDNDDNNEGF